MSAIDVPPSRRAREGTAASRLATGASTAASRLATAASGEFEPQELEDRLATLEAQHGIETPAPSCPGSRAPTGRRSASRSALQSAARSSLQTPARSNLGTPARPPTHSQSSPELIELEPSLPVINEIRRSGITRQVGYRRSPSGSFVKDVPEWAREHNPVVPSRHRYLSNALWMSTNPCYEVHPEESDYRGNLVDHEIGGPPLKAFMNPRDKNTLYTEEKFKVGNKQIMRKGGGTMAKKKD